MHVVSKDFNQCNLTGKLNGVGKIKVRVDERQEEIINKRMEATPNVTTKKLEEGN